MRNEPFFPSFPFFPCHFPNISFSFSSVSSARNASHSELRRVSSSFPAHTAQKNYLLFLYPVKGRKRRNCASRASSSYFLFCSFFPHDIRQTDLGRSGAQITNCLLHPPLFVCGKLVLRPQRFKKSPFFDSADSKGAHPTLVQLQAFKKRIPFLCNAADTSCKSVLLSEL